MTKLAYDPRTFQPLTFYDTSPAFTNGTDTPRAYLERCLETIANKEPKVQAFAAFNKENARKAADESTERWKSGQPLSPIDGMPIGIKDLFETKDMPTQMGCDAYADNFPKSDNACVWALRQAGAVIAGKTVTAELGGNHPGPTKHPFDLARTPGGSSSGSAAAIAAQMLPAAMGSQVGGSIIRPAAFCGNFALKPTQGGIHRGERQATSMSTHGPHAGCIEDMWMVAIEIAKRTGGDPGRRGLMGPSTPPSPIKPERLIVLETEGWDRVDQGGHDAFAKFLDSAKAAGISLIHRTDHPVVEALETSIADATHVCGTITAWENRWALRNLINRSPDGVSQRTQDTVAHAESLEPDDYRSLLLARAHARHCHTELSSLADAVISFACPGPAPLWPGDIEGKPLAPRPTGDAVFNYPSSMIGAPVTTVPVM
ncbi:MAG: amidase, partial [Verrucomicrobiota bacterium]|nr:amidase [Verrucomicrobiota bacterium]